ncbi:hypothetical protein BDP55DRAFT_757027 [Colletotrichum godetiae]|uniref:Uncharacterized protein n=1 Tax=Colletotrichum godetiae TaxID=1209918 RepID=A0AAJ0A9U0_9PEZI|nr:uncharacterized protein BDP55DRAFT_757027 [Colletotrichum godetiae]KAK1659195.1 hypothetical protein BDP55DRAFT_757027 [Colletotrichum godetiae]
MTHPHANQEALKIILTKLNRLELRFDEIDGRLGAIECSVVSDASTSLPSSPPTRQSVSSCICTLCDIPRPLFQESDTPRQCSASTYRTSVDRLRRRFELDACSELAPRISEEKEVISRETDVEGIIDDNSDAQSVSAYPSRSVSLFSFTPREASLSRDAPDVPSLRYEDLMIHAEQISYSESSRRSRRSSTTGTFSESYDSPSTARTSFTQGSWAGSRRSSTTDTFSKMRGSLRRVGSLRHREDLKTENRNGDTLTGTTQDPSVAARTTFLSPGEREDVLHVYQKAQRSAKACVAFGQRFVYRVGKRMVNMSAIEKA